MGRVESDEKRVCHSRQPFLEVVLVLKGVRHGRSEFEVFEEDAGQGGDHVLCFVVR